MDELLASYVSLKEDLKKIRRDFGVDGPGWKYQAVDRAIKILDLAAEVAVNSDNQDRLDEVVGKLYEELS